MEITPLDELIVAPSVTGGLKEKLPPVVAILEGPPLTLIQKLSKSKEASSKSETFTNTSSVFEQPLSSVIVNV